VRNYDTDGASDFDFLTPDTAIRIAEEALSKKFGGLAAPMPSYINRVYEFEALDKTRYVAKFYRPGRWDAAALQDEHDFALECAEAELPVAPPLVLSNGKTLGFSDGVHFAIYAKRSGRQFEINNDDDYKRVGRLVGRLHNVGARKRASARLTLSPAKSTADDVAHLLDNNFVSPSMSREFELTTNEIVSLVEDLFDESEFIRVHGDLHRGNILERPGEGLLMIDFDDMLNGPPVQDLWLLLPDHMPDARREFDLIIDGYEEFRESDYSWTRLVEPLRAMRIIYFLAWCSRQVNDYKFKANFPDWGGDSFWRREVADLKSLLNLIRLGLPS